MAAMPRAVELHADVPRAERKRALLAFETGAANVLVCSDLAARGLDFAAGGGKTRGGTSGARGSGRGGVSLVVQYDLARNAAEYLHRAGRAGRLQACQGHVDADADGEAGADAGADDRRRGRVVSLVKGGEQGRARMLAAVVEQGGDVVVAEQAWQSRLAASARHAPGQRGTGRGSRGRHARGRGRRDASSRRAGGSPSFHVQDDSDRVQKQAKTQTQEWWRRDEFRAGGRRDASGSGRR